MNRDVFISVLAMDAYNRGYGTGIQELNEFGRLGYATLLSATAEQKIGWVNADFYAIAYDMTGVAGFADGETVISFRGTDNLNADAEYGYPLALGNIGAAQGILANSFYHAVTGAFIGQPAADVTLTGHSLGGGLAGYVGAVSGVKNVVFDHMPFGIAAEKEAAAVGVSSANFSLTTAIYAENEFLTYARNGAYQTVATLIGGVPRQRPWHRFEVVI